MEAIKKHNDLMLVAQTVRFSWPFTLTDIATKWRQMLFQPQHSALSIVVSAGVITRCPYGVPDVACCCDQRHHTRKRVKARTTHVDILRAKRLGSMEHANPWLNLTHTYVASSTVAQPRRCSAR